MMQLQAGLGRRQVVRELRGELEVEVQKSERFRALFLAVLGLGTMVGFLIRNHHAGADDVMRLEGDRVLAGALMLASFAVYELAFALGLHLLLLRNRRLPNFGRFINSIFEILYLYTVTWVLGHGVSPQLALEMPSTYLPFVLIALSALRISVGLSLTAGFVGAAGYVVLYLLLMQAYSQPVNFDFYLYSGRVIALLLLGVVTAIIGSVTSRWMMKTIRAHADRERIVQIFGQQVSPAVVDKLLSQSDLGAKGEMRNVSVLFVDIRNFTAFSESRSPEEIVAFLNKMFAFMVDEINKHSGIVNKFLGDGFMAVFGAPLEDNSASRNALDAARQMLVRLDELKAAGELPDVQLGIGLNAGQVLTGQVGGEERKEYTIIGDVVNLASRLESMNKDYGTRLIVSEHAVDQLANQGDLVAKAQAHRLEALGTAQVRGRLEPVRIFRG